MRNSYFTHHVGPFVILLRDVVEQLNVGYNSVLYAIVGADGFGPPVAYVSSIPVASWKTAYKIVVYTASKPGSLYAVTKELRDLGINQLVAWAGGISADGELCMTAIVDIPSTSRMLSRTGGPATEPDKVASVCQETLTAKLDGSGCLSRSPIFGLEPGTGVRSIRCVPLRVLQRLHSQYVEKQAEREYKLNVRGWELSLIQEGEDDRAALYDRLRGGAGGQEALGEVVLITPDTEERYCVLALLHSRDIRKITLPLEATSRTGDFSGLFERALETISGKQLNLYSARNIVEMKETTSSSGAGHVEKAVFEFHVDTSQSPHAGETGALLASVASHLRTAYEGERERRTVRIDEKRATISGIHGSETLVFVATNAKPSMPEEHRDYAVELLRRLWALGLHPVNVDVKQNPKTLVDEITGLLEACPILVSLYLPEDGNRLRSSRASDVRGRGRRASMFAPSDYTMFEEAYMTWRGRYVLRLRHESVFGPRYAQREMEKEFSKSTFAGALGELVDRMERIFRTPRWRECVFECSGRMEAVQDAVMNRDLYGWIKGEHGCGRSTRGGKAKSPTRKGRRSPSK